MGTPEPILYIWGLRQQKMQKISFRDNENNRWNKDAKKKKTKAKKQNKRTTTTKRKQKKTEKNKRGKEVIVKGWGLNDFVVNLS